MNLWKMFEIQYSKHFSSVYVTLHGIIRSILTKWNLITLEVLPKIGQPKLLLGPIQTISPQFRKSQHYIFSVIFLIGVIGSVRQLGPLD